MTSNSKELIELERDGFERSLRIQIWNGCKAANMKDDAAMRCVNREIERVRTEARATQSPEGGR